MSLLTPIYFCVPSLIFGPMVAKYLAVKGGFRDFLKKLLAQLISYLAFILMGWLSWPLYIFMFLASFRPSGGQIFVANFLHFPNFLHKLLRYLEYHDTLVGKMMPKFFWNKVFLKNSHLCSTQLQKRNLYWIFLDEVGSDQSGCILSPFMGTACLFRMVLI